MVGNFAMAARRYASYSAAFAAATLPCHCRATTGRLSAASERSASTATSTSAMRIARFIRFLLSAAVRGRARPAREPCLSSVGGLAVVHAVDLFRVLRRASLALHF